MAKAAGKKKAAKAAKKATKKATEKPLTKTQIYTNLSEKTGLAKKDVAAVFDALHEEIAENLHEGRDFVVPGLIKITKREVPARPAGEYYDNFSKTMKYREAKPASQKIALRPLKGLKDVVSS